MTHPPASPSRPSFARPLPLVVVMGVSGAGKTTVGRLVADRLGAPFADADAFHPASNKALMAAGIPLGDTERAPWLAAIADWLTAHAAGGGVVTCSALKRRYRDALARTARRALFVHLDGPAEVIADRLAHRTGHFMPACMLGSQLADLEPLAPDEHGVRVPVGHPARQVADLALARLPCPHGTGAACPR
ncbi:MULTISPECIES: gluconokinase [Streptomyces]|uniref:gluconokinase n=1 Tax=Streptomyces TaxID=1883 RepID=UPI00163BB4E9|nr:MULTISPECIES: gluconokinase [Streptomyces]MBC2878305.1 gluconokinase [Streptomyces sp. TYQ1024]UBI40579.1 gluconokinase [Streptomyces mobaraensis]UKW33160.1 gluconokinase [Streptomyces sp. TYQ1024]